MIKSGLFYKSVSTHKIYEYLSKQRRKKMKVLWSKNMIYTLNCILSKNIEKSSACIPMFLLGNEVLPGRTRL